MKPKLSTILLLSLLAIPAPAATNFVWIPYMHPTASPWWTNIYSIPDEVTNWQGWQAVNENFRRASNALATAGSGGSSSESPWRSLVEVDAYFENGIYTTNSPVVIGDFNGYNYIEMDASGWFKASQVVADTITCQKLLGSGWPHGWLIVESGITNQADGHIILANGPLSVSGCLDINTATNKIYFGGTNGASIGFDGYGSLLPSGGISSYGNITAAGGPTYRFIGNGSGITNIPSASITGLADAQTNAMLNSFRVPTIVSNNIVISAGATNIMGWVTNLAGVEFTYPNVTVTNSGWWTTNGPLLLYSFDGSSWSPGLASLITNVAVQIAFYSGSMSSNPPTQQIPLPGYVTNFTAYRMVRPDLFGGTNASFGVHMLVGDPVWPSEAATKNYVDSLFTRTAWWNASGEVMLNGYNLNMSSTWQASTDQFTNSSAYHLRFLGEDLFTATMSAPVPTTISSVTVTNSTNVVVRAPTNGASYTPRLQISHYAFPTVWRWLTNTPTVVTTNYVWTFPTPYSDSGFLIAMVPSTNPPIISLGGLLSLPSRTIPSNTASTFASPPPLICADSNYLYISVGTNLWKRAALSTW